MVRLALGSTALAANRYPSTPEGSHRFTNSPADGAPGPGPGRPDLVAPRYEDEESAARHQTPRFAAKPAPHAARATLSVACGEGCRTTRLTACIYCRWQLAISGHLGYARSRWLVLGREMLVLTAKRDSQGAPSVADRRSEGCSLLAANSDDAEFELEVGASGAAANSAGGPAPPSGAITSVDLMGDLEDRPRGGGASSSIERWPRPASSIQRAPRTMRRKRSAQPGQRRFRSFLAHTICTGESIPASTPNPAIAWPTARSGETFRHSRVASDPPVPPAGGRQGGRRPRPATRRELKREPATKRAPDEVSPLKADRGHVAL